MSIVLRVCAEENMILKILLRKMSTGFPFWTELVTSNPQVRGRSAVRAACTGARCGLYCVLPCV